MAQIVLGTIRAKFLRQCIAVRGLGFDREDTYMPKPTKTQSITQEELQRKYQDGNWDERRKSLRECVLQEKIWQPSSNRATVKKRTLACKDDDCEIVLALREYTHADGSVDVIITVLVEGDTAFHAAYERKR
jgi:hypothetical protein